MEMNKIYNMDCYEGIKQLDSNSIDLVYIDIPYLISSGFKNRTLNDNASGVSKRIARLINNDLNTIIDGIDYSLFDELVRVMKYIYIYIWCSKDQILDITNYFVKKHNCTVNYLVWCKTNPTPMCNGSWLPDLEYCLIFKGEGAPRYNDGYELKSKWYLSPINKGDKDLFDHPTIRPLELVKRHILHSTNENDVVLDCFIGSGTTAVACKETNRKYIGFEIDPKYYKIAIDRLDNINQIERKILNNGQKSIFD